MIYYNVNKFMRFHLYRIFYQRLFKQKTQNILKAKIHLIEWQHLRPLLSPNETSCWMTMRHQPHHQRKRPHQWQVTIPRATASENHLSPKHMIIFWYKNCNQNLLSWKSCNKNLLVKSRSKLHAINSTWHIILDVSDIQTCKLTTKVTN